jgi:hypothetical protein
MEAAWTVLMNNKENTGILLEKEEFKNAQKRFRFNKKNKQNHNINEIEKESLDILAQIR